MGILSSARWRQSPLLERLGNNTEITQRIEREQTDRHIFWPFLNISISSNNSKSGLWQGGRALKGENVQWPKRGHSTCVFHGPLFFFSFHPSIRPLSSTVSYVSLSPPPFRPLLWVITTFRRNWARHLTTHVQWMEEEKKEKLSGSSIYNALLLLLLFLLLGLLLSKEATNSFLFLNCCCFVVFSRFPMLLSITKITSRHGSSFG